MIFAGAVTEFALGRDQFTLDGESARGTERVGFLAHRARNLADTAMLAFEELRTGNVGMAGSTAAILRGNLMRIRTLMDRALSEIRLPQALLNRKEFLIAPFIDELAPAATLEAHTQGITFTVERGEDGVVIDGDRHVLAAVVGNLLQNAFKFTGPGTTVTLRVGASAERVLIEILDECGGLPEAAADDLFRAYEERLSDGPAVSGLGLIFSRWGVEANDGRISARNLPDKGCVFTIDLPRVPVLAVALP
jgi:signal transduction histidine kinase